MGGLVMLGVIAIIRSKWKERKKIIFGKKTTITSLSVDFRFCRELRK